MIMYIFEVQKKLNIYLTIADILLKPLLAWLKLQDGLVHRNSIGQIAVVAEQFVGSVRLV